MIPFSLPPLPRDERPPDDLRLDDDFPAEDVDREELRGDLTADVLAVLDEAVFDVPLAELERPDFAVRELPLLPLPLADVFDRADVVLRDEDDLELPLFDELLLEPPRDEELLLLPREDEPLLLPPLLLRDELLRPPLELFLEELPLRLDDELLLRPPLELFFDEDDPPDDRLLLVTAAPFLPAALFCAELPPRLDEPERELEADFLEPPLEERELEDFEPPLEDLELEPEDLFELPPDEDRDDDELFDDELFFEPPLLLELDDEREPLDFLVVAMQIIPPIIFGMILHDQQLAICVPFTVLYQVETARK